MSCENKKKYEQSVKTLFTGVKDKKFSSLKDLSFLKNVASSFREKPFNINTLKTDFKDATINEVSGKKVKIKYGKFLHHLQTRKDDRSKIIGLVKPTLEDPLFIVHIENKEKGKTEKRYYKPFLDPNDNLIHMMSFVVNHGEVELLTTSFDANLKKINESILNGELVYIKKDQNHTNTSLNKEATILKDSDPYKTSITQTLSNVKNDFLSAKDKRDFTVDAAWNTIMSTLELGATPIKYILKGMGSDINLKKNWFKVSEAQKLSSDLINDYRNLKAGIYDGASDIQKYLSTLDKKDSAALVHALGGDLDKEDLNPTLLPIYERFRSVIDEKAMELVKLGVLSEEAKIGDYLKRYYKQYIEQGHSGSSLAFSILHKRKDLSKDERIALGMIEDADFVIPNTIAEQNILIQKAKLLKNIADTFAKDTEEPGYVKVSSATLDNGVNKYGALAGKYVPKDVKIEIDNARIIQQEMRIVEDGLYPLIDHLKVNLTVKNPVTHVYNIASNMLLAGLNGDFKALGKVLYMRVKNPKQFKELLKTANKYGLNSYLDDFEQAHVDLKPKGKKVNIASSIQKNLYMTQDSK
ncbi:MAG: hypothetical protein HRT68_16310, partial [Flavobacteriaceae bacterium]|nr:hypothetical protein [Flavobacteriaceae bacterium]